MLKVEEWEKEEELFIYSSPPMLLLLIIKVSSHSHLHILSPPPLPRLLTFTPHVKGQSSSFHLPPSSPPLHPVPVSPPPPVLLLLHAN